MPPGQFHWERDFWRVGLERIAGVDEVGRGALAGPLVAAAVIFDPVLVERRSRREALQRVVHDSKLMSRAARESAIPVIESSAVAIGTGIVECFEIDDLGISAANRLAMERAVHALEHDVDLLLLDAFVTDLEVPQVGLIDGDAVCLSIAAASIVAKVTRDRMMCRLHELDERYGMNNHVGYGTPEHLRALRAFGPAPCHRRSFAPIQELLRAL